MKKISVANFRTVPRWVILIIDVLLLTWTFSLSFFLAEEFVFKDISSKHFLSYMGLYTCLAAGVFSIMRVHTGLIRYANTLDITRIFLAMLVLTLLYVFALHALLTPLFRIDTLNIPVVASINFFIATSALILLRLVAKKTYHILTNGGKGRKKVRVLIYGTDASALMAKQALESNVVTKLVTVAFVDNNRGKLNSYIDQKRVYHIKDLPKLKEKYGVEQLVLVKEDLDSRDKKIIMERCLRLGIQVLTVPPAREWAAGKLSMKQVQNLRIEDLLQRKPIVINNDRLVLELEGKRILVTGASGSIGSEIVRQLMLYNPGLLILCDQAESPLHEIQLELEERYPHGNTQTTIADIRNSQCMRRIFETHRPQLVFHAAAYKHVPMMENNPLEAIRTNVGGTKNLADLSVMFDVEKFVMISTDKAVNPTNVMGASKRIAEIYTQSLDNLAGDRLPGPYGRPVKTRFITTRFGNVLGSNGSVIPRFKMQIEKGGPLTVTHPEITRYFMTIPEAVQLVLEAGAMGKGGEIFVFDMGKPVKIVDLAKKMILLAGLKPDVDISITYTGLRKGEKLYEELLNEAEQVMPTHHEKISIARVRGYAYTEAAKLTEGLLRYDDWPDNESLVKKMKIMVPEFLSKNSPYEALDNVHTV